MRYLLIAAILVLAGCPKRVHTPQPGEYMTRQHFELGAPKQECQTIINFEWDGNPDFPKAYILLKLEDQYFGVGGSLEETGVTYSACLEQAVSWQREIRYHIDLLPPGVNMNPEPQWLVMPFPYHHQLGPAQFEIPNATVWKVRYDQAGPHGMIKEEVKVGITITIYPATTAAAITP